MRHRFSSVYSKPNTFSSMTQKIRNFGLDQTLKDDSRRLRSPAESLTKAHAIQLVMHLKENERKLLFDTLQACEFCRIDEKFEDALAWQRWRRDFEKPTMNNFDFENEYCPMPSEWLKKKHATLVKVPTIKELLHLSLASSIPFIGFGFLDNFIMITAGDTIEATLAMYITISTMTAAALGNMISDVVGLGTAYYVERAAFLLGFRAPRLLPSQLDLTICKRFINTGRILGVLFGCCLGTSALLFRRDKKQEQTEKKS